MMTHLRFIDLFAGLGGLRIGLEAAAEKAGADVQCVFTSEIKPTALVAYARNFPGDTISGDITQESTSDIPEFDILLAGFPCQPFSSAGKGRGFEDTRGTLFFDIERILEAHQPKAFILENVEGLVNHDKKNPKDEIGNTLTVILDRLKDLGYQVNWRVFDASHFGLPQKRRRIYIVGTREKLVNLDEFQNEFNPLEKILEEKYDENLVINSGLAKQLLASYSEEALWGKQIKDKRGGKNNIHSWDLAIKGPVSETQKQLMELLLRQRRRKSWAISKGIPWADGMPLSTEEIYTFAQEIYPSFEELDSDLKDLKNKGYLAFEKPKKGESHPGFNIVVGKLSFEISHILHPKEATPTLVATDVTRLAIVQNQRLRRLSVREGLRLFGFPDSYVIPSSMKYEKAFDLLGNSVTLNVVKMVSLRVLEAIRH